MLVKPIDNLVKNKFDLLFTNGNENATQKYSTLNEKLLGKSLLDQATILKQEIDQTDKIIEESDYPFYIDNYNSPNSLIKLFANRTFLLNVDDSRALQQSIFLGAYRRFLFD